MCGPQVAALNQAHHEVLFRFARLFLGNAADAEEVVQDIYVKLLEQRADLPGSITRPWLYRVVFNACSDYRKSWWQRRGRGSVDVSALALLVDGGPTPEVVLLEQERAAELRRVLQQLPPRLRAPVILRDMEGLSYDDIALALACSMGTVSSRLNRGRRILARTLGRERP
jgi:RNA polymerase sigma-70 factor (ECF subfamily)